MTMQRSRSIIKRSKRHNWNGNIRRAELVPLDGLKGHYWKGRWGGGLHWRRLGYQLVLIQPTHTRIYAVDHSMTGLSSYLLLLND